MFSRTYMIMQAWPYGSSLLCFDQLFLQRVFGRNNSLGQRSCFGYIEFVHTETPCIAPSALLRATAG